MAKITISITWAFFFGIIFFCSEVNAGTVTIQTGVATLPSGKKGVNIAKLRQQAISNAIDLAILQITGVEISSKHGNSLRTQDEITYHNGHAEESSKQKDNFSTAVYTRTEGHARLVKIIKEWRNDNQYHVKAEIEVDNQEELLKKKNAGYFWTRVGRPSIGLFMTEVNNGEEEDGTNHTTFRFFRDNLSRNGIKVSTETADTDYKVQVHQVLNEKELPALDTVTVNCRLSFQLVDQIKNESIAEYRASHGPTAGFSIEQGREDCLKAIAPKVSEQLVREIAKVMNNLWNNGIEHTIIIDHMPGKVVPEVTELLNNLFRVTSALKPSYITGKYTQKISFKGDGDELSQGIKEAFEAKDWDVQVKKINKQIIRFDWQITNE